MYAEPSGSSGSKRKSAESKPTCNASAMSEQPAAMSGSKRNMDEPS
jgi:hypothetical protein